MSSRDILMSANVTFWMADVGRAGVNDEGRGIAFDNTGNVYVAGYPETSFTVRDPWFLAKYAADGSLIWQKNITGGGSATQIPDDQPLSMIISGNFIYMFGSFDQKLSILKIDLDGTVIWRTGLNLAFGANINGIESSRAGDSIAVDVSNNVYVCRGINTDSFFVAKFNSSGVLQWQTLIKPSSSSLFVPACITITQQSPGYGVTERVFVHGYHFPGFSSTPISTLTTIDLNGNVLSYDELTTGATEKVYSAGAVVFGASSTKYLAFTTDANVVYVAGFNGTWTSKITGFPSTTVNGTRGGITNTGYDNPFGSEEFVYSCFCVSNQIYIFKHNKFGTLMFQRVISLAPTFTLRIKRIRADKSGNLYFVGTSTVVEQSASTNIFFGKIPTDGSLTGTYMLGASPNGYVTYAASTLSTTSGTVGLSSFAYTALTPTYTTVVPTTTTSAATFSSTTVII